MIDNKTINPYDLLSYKKKRIKIFNSKKDDKERGRKDLVDYEFDLEVTGSNTDKKILLSTGYIGKKGEESYFILDEDDLDRLITELSEAKEILKKSRCSKDQILIIHQELEKYLKAGYIESITLEYKKNFLPPYFNKELYKAFNVRPNFKKDIDIPSWVNIGFNFIEVYHLDINEGKFDEVMNYIRHYYDIPIHFIGYDHMDEIRKREKAALKELDDKIKSGTVGTDPTQAKIFNSMLNDMGIPHNVINFKKKKDGK